MTYEPDRGEALVAILTHYGATHVPEGRNRAMRCPLHPDAHASASVSTDEGVYLCHGCGASGDAYSLVQQQEGCSFVDAKRIVESLSGDGDSQLSRDSRAEGGYLPRKSGHRPGRRGFVPTWRSRHAGNGA